ncbi:MAG TPA: hypothetical protein VFO98_11885 [Marmoricola sp.]|nr:hypothetical protein [Marmoricola sp.]
MLSPKIGEASIVLNPQEDPATQRTYVTFGLERGGTSPIAGIQRALGLYLGRIPGGNNEDPAFHNHTIKAMRETIAGRDAAHDVWGFKYPNAGKYLPTLVRSLREPSFVIVFRDPVATALSRARWDGDSLRRPPRMALHEASSNGNANLSFALATGRPTMLVSTERVERHTSALIDEIASFLGVQPPEEDLRTRILEYLTPGSYKKFEEYFPEQVAAEARAHEAEDSAN